MTFQGPKSIGLSPARLRGVCSSAVIAPSNIVYRSILREILCNLQKTETEQYQENIKGQGHSCWAELSNSWDHAHFLICQNGRDSGKEYSNKKWFLP